MNTIKEWSDDNNMRLNEKHCAFLCLSVLLLCLNTIACPNQ